MALQHCTAWQLRAVDVAAEDLILRGPEDGLVAVEWSDVHLIVAVAVADVAEEARVEHGPDFVTTSWSPGAVTRTFDDTVSRLRRAVSFVVSLPRPESLGGVDFVCNTLNGFVFNRITYRAEADQVVAELRFVRAYHAVTTEQERVKPDDRPAA